MTARASTTRRSPRRHFGAWVVSHYIAAIQTAIQPVRRHFPSVIGIAAPNSPAGGGACNSGSRSVVAHLSRSARIETRANGPCAERDSTSVRVVPAIRGNQFNADRAPESPIGGQARFSRGRRHQRPPAFRSQIRQAGCVRLSGGQTYQPSVCSYNRAPVGPGLASAGRFSLSEGLSGSRNLDVGLIERYVERFRDVTPILFLCERHLRDSSDRQAAAIEQLHVLMRQLAPVMEAAGLTQAPAGKRSR